MKGFLWRFLLAAALTALAFALAPALHAQQADQDPAPATPHRTEPAPNQPAQQNEAQMPASGAATTHEAKTFSGRIVKENGEIVLKDPVTKVRYKLSDQSKVRQYLDKQVKITGKLDADSNTIQIKDIGPF